MRLATKQIVIYYLFLIGLVLSTFVYISKKFPFIVEHFYSQMLYNNFAIWLRSFTSKTIIPIGDILFVVFVLYIFYLLYYWISRIIRRQRNRVLNLKTLFFIFSIGLFFYSIFNSAWGLNYNRLGANYQLHLEEKEDFALFTDDELDTLSYWMVKELNRSYSKIYKNGDSLFTTIYELRKASDYGFERISQEHELFFYKNTALKISFFQNIIPFFSIIGYFNPFTNEAIISNKGSMVMLPFTANYEIAHSLGYAKEQDANFIAFLASKLSDNTYMYYSTLANIYFLIYEEMENINVDISRQYFTSLDTGVQNDIMKIKHFHENAKGVVQSFFNLSIMHLVQNSKQDRASVRKDTLRFIFLYLKKFTKSFDKLEVPNKNVL